MKELPCEWGGAQAELDRLSSFDRSTLIKNHPNLPHLIVHESAGAYLGAPKEWSVAPEHLDEASGLQLLWYQINDLCGNADALADSALRGVTAIDQIDGCGRHDELLSESARILAARTLGSNSSQISLKSADTNLRGIHNQLEALVRGLDASYYGVQKTMVLDKIRRHIQSTEDLLSVLQELDGAFEMASKPYEVRKAAVSDVLIALLPMVKSLSSHREDPRYKLIPPRYVSRVESWAVSLRRIKSDMQRWRDNPSQRLSAKMRLASEELLRVCQEICLSKDCCYLSARKIGMRFCTRVGWQS